MVDWVMVLKTSFRVSKSWIVWKNPVDAAVPGAE